MVPPLGWAQIGDKKPYLVSDPRFPLRFSLTPPLRVSTISKQVKVPVRCPLSIVAPWGDLLRNSTLPNIMVKLSLILLWILAMAPHYKGEILPDLDQNELEIEKSLDEALGGESSLEDCNIRHMCMEGLRALWKVECHGAKEAKQLQETLISLQETYLEHVQDHRRLQKEIWALHNDNRLLMEDNRRLLELNGRLVEEVLTLSIAKKEGIQSDVPRDSNIQSAGTHGSKTSGAPSSKKVQMEGHEGGRKLLSNAEAVWSTRVTAAQVATPLLCAASVETWALSINGTNLLAFLAAEFSEIDRMLSLLVGSLTKHPTTVPTMLPSISHQPTLVPTKPTMHPTSAPTFSPILAEVLVVAGGGGNQVWQGSQREGGSGAGGVIFMENVVLPAGTTFSLSVGAGASGHANGGDSTFQNEETSYTAFGGGFGGNWDGMTGANGGSGGGSWYCIKWLLSHVNNCLNYL